jgi:hypothetical protein
MRVFLDDVRPTPEGWERCYTPEEVIDLLRSGRVTRISLDHDLGLLTEEGRERTGYDVLLWIEQQVATGHAEFPIPEIEIHSANSVGRRRMEQAIRSIQRLASQKDASA